MLFSWGYFIHVLIYLQKIHLTDLALFEMRTLFGEYAYVGKFPTFSDISFKMYFFLKFSNGFQFETAEGISPIN